MVQRWQGDVILDESTLMTIDEVDEGPFSTWRSSAELPEEGATADVLDQMKDSPELAALVRWIDAELRQRVMAVEDKLSSLLLERPSVCGVLSVPFSRRRSSRSQDSAFHSEASDGGARRRRGVVHGRVPFATRSDASEPPGDPAATRPGLARGRSGSNATFALSRSISSIGADCPVPVVKSYEPRIKTRSREAMVELESRLHGRLGRCGCHNTIWHFLEEPDSSFAAMAYSRALPILIMLSVVLTILQSGDPAPLSGLAPALIDVAIDAFFSIEVIVRWFASPRWCRFVFSCYNLIDLTSLATLALRVAVVRHVYWGDHSFDAGPQLGFPAAAVALECVAPVMRMLKLLRRFEQFHLLYHAFELAFEALPVLLYTGALLLLSASALLFVSESRDNIESFPRAMWLSVVTMSTVGYGDYYPQSTPGTLFASLLIMASALYMSIPLGIVGNAFHRVWEDRDRLLLMRRTKKRLAEWGYTPRDINTFFQLFSSSGDGVLGFHDFGNMIDEMKLGLGPDRARELFEMFDSEGRGTILPEDFVAVLFPSTAYESVVDQLYRSSEGQSVPDSGEDSSIVSGTSRR